MPNTKTPVNKNAPDAETLQDRVEHAAESIRDTAYEAGEKVRQYASAKFNKADALRDDLESVIQQDPTRATFAALAIGFVIGFLARR